VDAERFYKLVVIGIFISALCGVGFILSWAASTYAPKPEPELEKSFLLTKLVFEHPVNASLPISIQNPYNFSVRVWVFVAPQNASQYIVYSVVPDLNGTVLGPKESIVATFQVTLLDSSIVPFEIRVEGEKA